MIFSKITATKTSKEENTKHSAITCSIFQTDYSFEQKILQMVRLFYNNLLTFVRYYHVSASYQCLLLILLLGKCILIMLLAHSSRRYNFQMVSIKRAAFRRTIIPKNVRIFSPITTPRSQNLPLKNFKLKNMYTNLKIQKVFPLKCFDLIQKILERFLPRVYLTKWIIYRCLKFYG